MSTEKTQSANKTGLFIALFIAILAFIISIIALQKYQNPNYPNQQILSMQNELREMRREMQLGLTRQRLESLRRDIEEGRNPNQVQNELSYIQQNLRSMLRNADANTQQRIREMDKELDRIKLQLRDNRADALQTIDTLLERLRQGI